jgi:hypothetical protein
MPAPPRVAESLVRRSSRCNTTHLHPTIASFHAVSRETTDETRASSPSRVTVGRGVPFVGTSSIVRAHVASRPALARPPRAIDEDDHGRPSRVARVVRARADAAESATESTAEPTAIATESAESTAGATESAESTAGAGPSTPLVRRAVDQRRFGCEFLRLVGRRRRRRRRRGGGDVSTRVRRFHDGEIDVLWRVARVVDVL